MKNYTNQLLEHLKSEKCTHLYLDNIWGADLANL